MFKVIEKNNMGISLPGIIDDVRGRLDDFLNQKRQVTPYHTNRASELGHRCLCYLYHCRANWDKRQPASSKQQSVYLEGLEQELSVIRLLLDLGFKIVEQGKSFSLPRYNITGKIDGFISNAKMKMGCEIKAMESYIFDAINSIDDFKNPKRPWLEKYLAQATLYMVMNHSSSWLFILKNKSRLEIKIIEYDFDLDFYNELIEKACAINKALEEKEPPRPISYNPYLCDLCPFNHLCGVEEFSGTQEMERIMDPDVKELVENYFLLKEAEEKFEIVKEDLKGRFSGKNVQVGDDYKILSRLVEVKPDPEPKPRKGYKYWTMKILKL